ncbi:carboxypeptidase [Asticcacaulis endophyticus]|uniref:Carboxypeptidase n=2 Tax=Asticcacaulis endophyticus TaxID=1395890 RepID=A0A918QEL1_9CAUL|nr:carboxypeptidase [Asticcacaulis endophyticus]
MSLGLMLSPATAQDAINVTTPRTLTQSQTTLNYTAGFTEEILKNDKGEAVVSLSAISYVRDGDKATRPVIVFFNGGPGASSSPLHMSAFGPRIRDKDALIDNPDTLLDAADLVFIDPPGTGLSRVFKADELRSFLGVNHDAAAVHGLIAKWLKANGRETSPLYIAGESYGGYRLAVMSGQIAKDKTLPNLKGLILISPSLNMSESRDMGQVLELPTLAAGAWHHNKIDRKGRSLEAIFNDAQSFAISTYAPALLKGAQITHAEKTDVAKGLSGLIGLPVETILAANLRVGSQTYLEALNADKDQLTGRLDMRVVAPIAPPANPNRPAAANDPSLGLGKSNIITSPLITRYLKDELNFPATTDYVSLSLELNFQWNWDDMNKDRQFVMNVTPDLATLMKDRPDLKMMVVGGYFDLATPVWAARYEIEHADMPLDRVTFNAYATGHSVFNPADNLTAKADQIRAFIKE